METFAFALDPYFATVGERLPRVLLSILIAMLSTFVALELAGRVSKAVDRVSARLWIVAGAVALGTGVWSMHFVGMSAAIYPFDAFYAVRATEVSWVLAVAVAGLLLSVAENDGLTTPRLWFHAVICGVGLMAMHFIGASALQVAPAVTYYPLWVVASSVCAIGGCALALSQVFRLRRRRGWRHLTAQARAAGLFGASLAGMHYLAMASINFADHTICLTRGGLDVGGLGDGVALASIGFLLLMLLITALERRAEKATRDLNASLRKAEGELRYVTLHDAVTGLPNRLVFQDRLARAVEQAKASGRAFAVFLVEIDELQSLLHIHGDRGRNKLMPEVAARLKAASDDAPTIAYVGNHQFLVLVDPLTDAQHAVRIAEQIGAAFMAPLRLASGAVGLSASVGVTLCPADGDDADIVRRASIALDSARRAGGNGYSFFEPTMDIDAHETTALLGDLRLAVQRGELELHYQPKVHAQSGKIAGAEALLRWRHPSRGMVGPDRFIPIAERFGVINEIGSWVISEACRQMAVWADSGILMRVAVNVSVIQLRQQGLASEITIALARRGIDPKRLTCEITETGAMQDTKATLEIFRTLEAAGIQISIDDFGTGYSSLSHLRKMPVRQLKVDRSFVKDLGIDADAEAVVAAIIQMAHALRLEVVAEGVETERQRDVLLHLGCDKFQGYLYARPMSAGAFTEMALSDASIRNSFRNSVYAA